MKRQARRGFTLVELLVVITIIGMLMALLLPAIQAAREAGRKASCMNNIKNISLAMLHYESARGAFPGWRNMVGKDGNGDPVITSWVAPLLPFLERNDLWKLYRDGNVPADEKPGVPGSGLYEEALLEVLVCPTNPSTRPAPLAYVVNAGRVDHTGNDSVLDFRANGVFHNIAEGTNDPALEGNPDLEMPLSYVSQRDGSQNTLMLAESLHAARQWAGDPDVLADAFPNDEGRFGFLWGEAGGDMSLISIIGADPENPQENDTEPDPGTVSSLHGGGVVVAFCSGTVSFLNDDINYRVYQHLMTPDGREARRLLGDSPGENLLGVLDEDDF